MTRNAIAFTAALLAIIQPAIRSVSADEPEMVRLAGTPEQIGTTWGKVNRDHVLRDMEVNYLKRAAVAGISQETLLERSAAFVAIAKQIAPHWLAEANATAQEIGVSADIYTAFVDGVARNRFLHECTSYAVYRDEAKDGVILFHKTRDNRDAPQAAYLVESSLEGINKFIAVSNATAIRCSMMVNEKGLAGSGDYPADKKKDSSSLHLEPAAPQYRGLMAGTILRHIAERAATCAEALAILEDCVAKGWYAGGDVGGSHWLFVDREGTILEVCNNARHVVSKVHTQKAYFSRLNKSAAAQRLRESAHPVDFTLFRAVSRDPSVCFGSSISGLTVEIDPNDPGRFTCAWAALPVKSVAFPLLMGQSGAPRCLVDGTAYKLGKQGERQDSRWEALEQSIHADKERLKDELAASIDAGNPDAVHVEAMDQWSRDQARGLAETLASPQ